MWPFLFKHPPNLNLFYLLEITYPRSGELKKYSGLREIAKGKTTKKPPKFKSTKLTK